jgi:hypothetical protein
MQKIVQTHVDLTDADTEYSVDIPVGATDITFKLRDVGADLKYYFETGAAEYMTLPAGASQTLKGAFRGLTIYFQSPTTNQVVEVQYTITA